MMNKKSLDAEAWRKQGASKGNKSTLQSSVNIKWHLLVSIVRNLISKA